MAEIRVMLASDIAAAQELWRNTEGMGLSRSDSAEGLTAFLEHNPGLSRVAMLEGRLVGTALCGHDGRRGMLYHVAVDAACRGQGLGRALVRSCLEALAAAGIGRCHLFVFNSNRGGLAFWQHEGWERRDDLTVFSCDTPADLAPRAVTGQ